MVGMFHWYESSVTHSLHQQTTPCVATKSQILVSSALSGLGLPLKYSDINGIQQPIQFVLKLKLVCQASK